MGRKALVQNKSFVSAPYKFFGFACKTYENCFACTSSFFIVKQ